MSQGWIKLHRKIQENDLWMSEPFTRGQAWVDLILLANHEDGYIYVRGNKVDIKRGQVGWSQKKLAERWSWSRTKVRKFLQDLEEEQQIKQRKNNVSTVITVINYNKYQPKSGQKNNRETAEYSPKYQNGSKEEQQKEQQNNGVNSPQKPLIDDMDNCKNSRKNSEKTAKKQQRNTNKNDKNVKKSGPPTTEVVENYFRRKGKMLKKDIPLEAEKFINHYADQDWKKSNGNKITNWHRQAGTWQANYLQWNEERLQREQSNQQTKQIVI